MQPCATIALLMSIRQGVLQLIKLRALLGGLRTCMHIARQLEHDVPVAPLDASS
jgi:hypothetical protein